MAVSDRGPGVPEDRLQRIFERFTKLDPSRSGGSSGLGLAIAAEHAALLGGYLQAMNREGGGLRLELVLPAARDPFVTRRRWRRDPGVREWDSNDHHEGVPSHEPHRSPHPLRPCPLGHRDRRRRLRADRRVSAPCRRSSADARPVDRSGPAGHDPGAVATGASAVCATQPVAERQPGRQPDAHAHARPRPRPTRWSSAPTSCSTATSVSRASCRPCAKCPRRPAVARAAMDALLRGEILADYDDLATGDPRGHAPPRAVDPRRDRDRGPVARVRVGRRQRLGVPPARPGRRTR